jgi:ElaB/YqjD/DUF883 family membrane-anchored ribosome-binding protein
MEIAMANWAYAAETGSGSGAATDVETELIALQADVRGLAESVQRLAAESPTIAKQSLEQSIRRQPVQATAIAAGIGFVLGLLLSR